MKSLHLSSRPLLPSFAALTLFTLAPSLHADDTRSQSRASLPAENEPTPAPGAAARRAQSARVLIGQDVNDARGKTLGEIHDLVVDPKRGEILFALVASGGLLGVGEEIRAVPFAALRQADDNSRDLTLDLPRDRWSQAPVLERDRFDTLSDRDVAREVFAFYDQALDENFDRAGTKARERMIRVSELLGADVENSGRKVGRIQDVIVHFDSRRASALLDPDNNYSGTDRQFLVNFAQLSPAGEDRLTTTLSREDFAGAPPAEDRWWTSLEGFPYWWGGYGGFGGPAYTGATDDLRTNAAIIGGEREGRRSVAVVRERLRRDPILSDQTQRVTIAEENGRLVLSGIVSDHAAKNAVHRLVSDYAIGWEIVDRLEVTAAE
jgi:Uncharacterized conserved protein